MELNNLKPKIMKYGIFVTPANKGFDPHFAKGFEFESKDLAEFYASQFRRVKREQDGRKNLYEKVEVKPI